MRPPTVTLAAVVSAAHTPQQRAARCTLGSLCRVMEEQTLASPAVLVIGGVAALGQALDGHLPPPAGGTTRYRRSPVRTPC